MKAAEDENILAARLRECTVSRAAQRTAFPDTHVFTEESHEAALCPILVARPALPASRDVHTWALASPQQLPRCGYPLPPWAYRRGPLSRRRCCCFGCCFSL